MMKTEKKVPELRFPEFEGEWENIRLEKIVTNIKSGNTKPNKEGKYNVYGSTGMIGKADNFTHEGQSILIARVGANAGLINLVCDKYCVTDNTLIVELLSQYSYHYIFYRLIKFNINRLIFGSGQPLVTAGELKKLVIKVPSLPEQQKIASFLSSADQRIQLLTQKKEKLGQYKKGIMQQIFSQQLRFKDEQGKEYPEWEEKRLGELGHTYNGLTGKTKEDFGDGKPYIQYMQIFKDSKINIEQCDYVRINHKENQNAVKFGDIFFTISSETPNEIGTASVLLDKVEGYYLNSFCFGYRPNDHDKLCPDFSRFFFRSEHVRRMIVKLAQGSTRYNMSKGELMKLSFFFPCKSEQQKIASFLSSLDEKISLVNQQIELTRKWKQGLLQKMFV